ncbi:MAG: thioredoxin family protein [Odoribacteraceae bacterium]|jgi:thiol-disulfide isomerase/thioredoxin|nr:thioredoxin family protein [Odoribacteraceae bacterium]
MNKTTIAITLAITLAAAHTAGAQGIRFDENPSWKATLERAAAAGKYIFVDCYTTWCGPCKTLDREVFANDDIGRVYNDRFINVKYDMEKGEGPALAKTYNVTADPTRRYIDPAPARVVHRAAGARPGAYFLEQADIATAPAGNLAAAADAYNTSDKTRDDLARYLDALTRAADRATADRVALDWLDALPDTALLDDDNFQLIERHARDPLAPPLSRVIADRGAFARALGAERVNRKIASALSAAVAPYIPRQRDAGRAVDTARLHALTRLVLAVDDPVAPSLAVQLRAADAAARGDHADILEALRDVARYNMLRGQARDVFCIAYLLQTLSARDTATLRDAAALADDIIAATTADYTRASFYQIKAMILDAAGDTTAADEAREKGRRQPVNPVPAARQAVPVAR